MVEPTEKHRSMDDVKTFNALRATWSRWTEEHDVEKARKCLQGDQIACLEHGFSLQGFKRYTRHRRSSIRGLQTFCELASQADASEIHKDIFWDLSESEGFDTSFLEENETFWESLLSDPIVVHNQIKSQQALVCFMAACRLGSAEGCREASEMVFEPNQFQSRGIQFEEEGCRNGNAFDCWDLSQRPDGTTSHSPSDWLRLATPLLLEECEKNGSSSYGDSCYFYSQTILDPIKKTEFEVLACDQGHPDACMKLADKAGNDSDFFRSKACLDTPDGSFNSCWNLGFRFLYADDLQGPERREALKKSTLCFSRACNRGDMSACGFAFRALGKYEAME